jgi:hypothetical protein
MKKIYYVFIMIPMVFLTLVATFELYGIIRSSHEAPIFAFFYAMHFFFSLLIFISFYILMKHKNETTIFFFVSLYLFKFLILLCFIRF